MVSFRRRPGESGEKRQCAQPPKGDEERLRPWPGRRQVQVEPSRRTGEPAAHGDEPVGYFYWIRAVTGGNTGLRMTAGATFLPR